jgi:hypothetical protein
LRASHRAEHLDEIEATVGAKGSPATSPG